MTDQQPISDTMTHQRELVMTVRNLVVTFDQGRDRQTGARRTLHAVDDVSFDLRRGETFGIVGESGCGKSTMVRAILQLGPMDEGTIHLHLDEKTLPLHLLSGDRLRRARRHIQIVFQDPFASLNPRMTVGDIVGEPLAIHQVSRGKERRQAVADLLVEVGLDPKHASRYPHEFSGGQRQRIGIARGLALNPEILVCDEPVSALDVSVRSQVLNLLLDLQARRGLSIVFIAHDLAIVKRISHRVGVMYKGKLVEVAEAESIYQSPKHPYTQALLSAIPIPDPSIERSRKRVVLVGDGSNTAASERGCRFAPRCPQRISHCTTTLPRLTEDQTGHEVACLLYPHSDTLEVQPDE